MEKKIECQKIGKCRDRNSYLCGCCKHNKIVEKSYYELVDDKELKEQ